MNKPTLLEHITQHMAEVTSAVNKCLRTMPGTPEEMEEAYCVLTQYYDGVVEHLHAAETMNVAARTLHDMYQTLIQKEKDKARELPGFDSIRPGQNTAPRDHRVAPNSMGCILCGGEMILDSTIIYTSLPPQYKYTCNKCGRTIVHPLIV